MKKFLLFGILVGLFVGMADGQTSSSFDTDFQIWNDIAINVPLDEKKLWTAQIVAASRLDNNTKTFVDARIGVNILRKINKNLTVGGGYLYRMSNATFRLRRYESRYIGNATFTIPFNKKTSLINRNLLIYYSLYSRPNTTIYRTRFWLTREIKVSKTKISPFVAFEQFWDFRLDAFARNRIQTGFTRKFNKKFVADFFYLRQNEGGRGLRRGTLNALGASWKVNL